MFTIILRSIGPGIAATIDQKVLPCDEPGVVGAKEGAVGAEFRRTPVAPRRIGCSALAPDLVEGLALSDQSTHMRLLRIAVEDAGQKIVDRDVSLDRLSRYSGDEADKTGASAV